MFELFTALFGGLFWGGKLASEKSATKKLRQDRKDVMNEHFSHQDDFESKVLDRELESDLEDFIYNTDNYDKVWEEVSKAYNEMPWKPEDEKFICICPEAVETVFGKGVYTKKQREQIAASYRKEALRIMMANRGKLIYSDVYFGFSSYGEGAPTVRICEKLNTESANLVLWINSKLKEHSIEEDVYIRRLNNEYFVINDKTKKCLGKYVWFPEILPSAIIHTDI